MRGAMTRLSVVSVLLLIIFSGAGSAPVADAASGQMTWAVHITIAPRWLDPGDAETAITPFIVLYALHDALVKPMPKGQTTPSLAESWTASPDWKTYDFVLKKPWPDFMTFYGTTASGAGWIVPKKYVQKVGDDGFIKAPIGAGPYRF